MRIDLTGRVALVNGSTSGIGRAIASGFARGRAEVVVNGRDQERAEAVAAEVAHEADAQGRCGASART